MAPTVIESIFGERLPSIGGDQGRSGLFLALSVALFLAISDWVE